jgi:hypothetical protein
MLPPDMSAAFRRVLDHYAQSFSGAYDQLAATERVEIEDEVSPWKRRSMPTNATRNSARSLTCLSAIRKQSNGWGDDPVQGRLLR